MLADSVISLAYVALRTALPYLPQSLPGRLNTLLFWKAPQGYTSLSVDESAPGSPLSDLAPEPTSPALPEDCDAFVEQDDAPLDQQVGNRTVLIGLVLSILFCVVSIHVVFNREKPLVPLYATVAAVGIALLLSISMSRALPAWV